MALLFAQPSSNPLDTGSGDLSGARWKGEYIPDPRRDSDAVDANMNSYLRHVECVVERRNATPRNTSVRLGAFYSENPDEMIDLDEDMDDDEPVAGPSRHGTELRPMEEDEEEEEGEEDAEGSVDSDGSMDVDEKRDSEDEEEYTLSLRPPEEQSEIRAQIRSLEKAIPYIGEDYKLVDRLGTGTFSTVFKAIDINHDAKWDNDVWRSDIHAASSRKGNVYVALKRIYVTSAPERIRNEICILETCRNARNVSKLITAFRERDQIVLVLPFQRNDDFRVGLLPISRV